MKIQRIYTKALNLFKNLEPVDFYTLIDCLKKGYEAYYCLNQNDKDDIDELYDTLTKGE